tara:strand:+ start:206 stop:478 length:273 start_codon:yes stop_codon:yes gene_type:complete
MFNPVNRYILVEVPETAEQARDSIIVLPEDYAPHQDRYGPVRAIAAAADVRFDISEGCSLIIDKGMIEEISFGGTIYNVILDNYVVGIVE